MARRHVHIEMFPSAYIFPFDDEQFTPLPTHNVLIKASYLNKVLFQWH